MPARLPERHLSDRIGWLRAAVLGANDGLISTSSLVVGVAAAATAGSDVLLAGAAGLVSGALSMAAGEYVSVSSQADTERADLAIERAELARDPAGELDELTQIYIDRGVSPGLARQVAEELTMRDALAAHARDELGLAGPTTARPVQAALASAASFSLGASAPVLAAFLAPRESVAWIVFGVALAGLAALGWTAARLGGAAPLRPTARVLFWGAFAMAATAAIGRLVGHSL